MTDHAPTAARRARGLTRALRPTARAAVLLGAGLALTACSGTRDAVGTALGLNYESPNPFNVSPHAPLRLPPSFENLPTPEPGERSPLEPRPEQAARAALSSAGAGAAPQDERVAPTPGELALLDAARASDADPAIRETLATELPPEAENWYALDSVLGYKIDDPLAAETLDAREETEELRSQGLQTPTPNPAPPEAPSNGIIIPLGG